MRVRGRPPPPSQASSDELICTTTDRRAFTDGEDNGEDIPCVILEGRTGSVGPMNIMLISAAWSGLYHVINH